MDKFAEGQCQLPNLLLKTELLQQHFSMLAAYEAKKKFDLQPSSSPRVCQCET